LEQDNAFLSSHYDIMLDNEETLQAEVDRLKLRLHYDKARQESEKYQLNLDLKTLNRNRNVILRHFGDLLTSLKEATETSSGEDGDLLSSIQNLVNIYKQKEIVLEMKE